MTVLLTRPDEPPGAPTSGRSLAVNGLVAAAAAASAGLLLIGVPVVVAWATALHSGAAVDDALRVALQVWLNAHHTGLAVPTGHVGMAPLGLTLLTLLLTAQAGGWVARAHGVSAERPASPLTLAACVGAVAAPYAVLTGLAAELGATTLVRPVVWQAFVGGGVVALVGALYGAARAGSPGPLLTGLPVPGPPLTGLAHAATLARATVGGLAVLLTGGALVVAGALLADVEGAAATWRAVAPGRSGGALLLLLCVVMLPNAVVWGAAYTLGPGFAVGAGTSVAPAGAQLGDLPALPLLAALPGGGSAPWWAVGCYAVPLAAGALSGLLVSRGVGPTASLRAVLGWALASGASVGVGMAVLAWVSGGPVAGEQLSAVGPSPWQTGVAAAVELGLVAAVAAWLHRRKG